TPAERILDLLQALGYKGTEPAIVELKRQVEAQIDAWAQDPFNPHRIARMRPVAYMKNVVMRYLDNLIEWTDHLFRQDTIEAINEATQLYVVCSNILKERGVQLANGSPSARRTFAQIRDSLDAFSNAHVAAETPFPFATLQLPSAAAGAGKLMS